MSDRSDTPDRQQLARERTEKADERTDLSEDRTLLANERTFAGWTRTAFASIGLGLGFQALLKKIEPVWVTKLIASLFIALGVWLIWKARQRAAGVLHDRSENYVNLMSSRTFRTTAIAVTIGAVLLTGALWWLI